MLPFSLEQDLDLDLLLCDLERDRDFDTSLDLERGERDLDRAGDLLLERSLDFDRLECCERLLEYTLLHLTYLPNTYDIAEPRLDNLP